MGEGLKHQGSEMENCVEKVKSVTFVSESRQIMVKLREIVWRGGRGGAVPQGGQGGGGVPLLLDSTLGAGAESIREVKGMRERGK